MSGRIPLGHIPPLGRFDWIEVTDGAGHYFKLPSLTTAQRNALTAITGMTIWNSDTVQAERYDGANWRYVAYTALTTHAADLDAHMSDLYQIKMTGNYFVPWPVETYGTVALFANSIYARPFFVARSMTIDALAIYITIAGAGGTVVRLGIYNDGTNLYPGSLIQDYGTVAVDGTGTAAIASDQALTKGLYWLVYVSDGTPTAHAAYLSFSPLGQLAINFYNTSKYEGWYKAAVGIGALADPFVAAAGLTVGFVPLILPKLKTLD